MKSSDRIFIAGHRGMVGRAITRELTKQGYENILTAPRSELNLCNQLEVNNFFDEKKPDHTILCAARVGGIRANDTFPAQFIYDNLMIEANTIHAAWQSGVSKLLYLGSSCIYPREASQPMNENSLLTGTLEKTNEPYAIAKIAGIKLCESFNREYGTDFRSVMPTNLYGPFDNFDLKNSHVLPALLRKFHEAKLANHPTVNVWGSGRAKREFLHVDDLASACVFILNLTKDAYAEKTLPMQSHINIGSGSDLSIKELAEMVASTVGYDGSIEWDTSMPDGTPRKLLDSSLISSLGWNPTLSLKEGLTKTYGWYREQL